MATVMMVLRADNEEHSRYAIEDDVTAFYEDRKPRTIVLHKRAHAVGDRPSTVEVSNVRSYRVFTDNGETLVSNQARKPSGEQGEP